MANVVRVRVEARRLRNDSPFEREKNFKILLREFNKRVEDAKIKQLAKEYQYFESPGEKARKKRRDTIRKHQQQMILDAIQRGESPKGAAKFRSKKKKKNRNNNNGNGRSSD